MSKGRFHLLVLAVGIGAFLLALLGDPFIARVLMWMSLNALIAAAMRFVLLVGEANMATAAFYGIGAYVASVCTAMWDLPFVVSLLAALVVAGLVAVAFGYGTMRSKGPYFMLISFAFAEIVRLIANRTDAIGGASGIVGIFPPRLLEAYFPAFVIGVIILLLLVLYAIERSRYGRIFRAILNNDAIVQSVGIDVLRMKVFCLAVASMALAVGGALYAHSNNVVSPGDFTILVSVYALAYVKLGGEEDPTGPIIGAALLTALGQFLLKFGQLELIFYGATLLVAILFMPNGLVGLMTRMRLLRDAEADAVILRREARTS